MFEIQIKSGIHGLKWDGLPPKWVFGCFRVESFDNQELGNFKNFRIRADIFVLAFILSRLIPGQSDTKYCTSDSRRFKNESMVSEQKVDGLLQEKWTVSCLQNVQ